LENVIILHSLIGPRERNDTVHTYNYKCPIQDGWAITMKTVFSAGSDPRLYDEDPSPIETEVRQSLETAVEDD
jgi:hypothetical protein